MVTIEVLPHRRPLKYAGKYRKPGDSISCSRKDARLLVALGHATYAKPEPESVQMDMVPEQTEKTEKTERKPKRKKRKGEYKTRDMQAEQE